MSLKKYDGKCVRITDVTGEVFEGNCYYNSKDYDEHEFGRNEESLQMLYFLFYNRDIKKIESLEKHKGPFGKFSESFGNLEKKIVEDGLYYIEDVLFSEDDEHTYRLLVCLNRYLNPESEFKLENRKEIIEVIRKLLNYNSNEKIQEEANNILEMWG